jgi:hypothetical protein
MDENILKIRYSKKEKDFLIYYPNRPDGALIQNHILGDILMWGGINNIDKERYNYESFNLKEELERRGYDLKTLKFEIKKLPI